MAQASLGEADVLDLEMSWKDRGWRKIPDGKWRDPEGDGPFLLIYETGEMEPDPGMRPRAPTARERRAAASPPPVRSPTAQSPEPVALAVETEFASASELLVAPEIGIEKAKKLWDTYREFREHILKDKECFDIMPGGTKEMNRTGATRLAMPFGLSVQELRSEETSGLALPAEIPEADRKHFPPEGDVRYKKLIDVSKGKRHVQGEGSCRLSEIEVRTKKGEIVSLSRREHDASTRAWTRAAKRGISDILGGTEA